jgi:hypothetical protein
MTPACAILAAAAFLLAARSYETEKARSLEPPAIPSAAGALA